MADPRIIAAQQRITSLTSVIDKPLYNTRAAVNYASDLVNFAPKFRFLYVVQVEFKPGFATGASNKFALLSKSATRPSPKFVTEEIPMYGVMVPVVKRTKFDPMTHVYLDDGQNEMMNFFSVATRWMSPITNIGYGAENLQYDFKLNQATNADGPRTPQPALKPHSYSIGTNPTPFLERITVHHVYDYGEHVNSYQFFSPVVTELTLDELDMGASELSSLKMVFDYTHFTMEIGKPMTASVAKLVGNATRMRNDL